VREKMPAGAPRLPPAQPAQWLGEVVANAPQASQRQKRRLGDDELQTPSMWREAWCLANTGPALASRTQLCCEYVCARRRYRERRDSRPRRSKGRKSCGREGTVAGDGNQDSRRNGIGRCLDDAGRCGIYVQTNQSPSDTKHCTKRLTAVAGAILQCRLDAKLVGLFV
jgi:hypothetical protein